MLLKLTTTCNSSSSDSKDIRFEHIPESSELNLEPPALEIEVTLFVAEDGTGGNIADNQDKLTLDDDSDIEPLSQGHSQY